jgi:hypothetical protein
MSHHRKLSSKEPRSGARRPNAPDQKRAEVALGSKKCVAPSSESGCWAGWAEIASPLSNTRKLPIHSNLVQNWNLRLFLPQVLLHSPHSGPPRDCLLSKGRKTPLVYIAKLT